MKPQYDNKILSSFLLYLDNKILTKGEAFTNHGSLLYPISCPYNGYYAYSSPFKQLVYDQSITGANQISGAYLNESFVSLGQSGLIAINPAQGTVYFDSNKSSYTISGSYAVKTDESEEDLLFEEKYELRPKTVQQASGLPIEAITLPVIYVKINSSEHEPFAFAGLDNAITNIRTMILADNSYSLDAICSIMRDCKDDRFTIIENTNLPINALGYTGSFNYSGVNSNKVPLIWSVSVSKFLLSKEMGKNMNPRIMCAFADFEISDIKTHK
jgi:hypothetical protein